MTINNLLTQHISDHHCVLVSRSLWPQLLQCDPVPNTGSIPDRNSCTGNCGDPGRILSMEFPIREWSGVRWGGDFLMDVCHNCFEGSELRERNWYFVQHMYLLFCLLFMTEKIHIDFRDYKFYFLTLTLYFSSVFCHFTAFVLHCKPCKSTVQLIFLH